MNSSVHFCSFPVHTNTKRSTLGLPKPDQNAYTPNSTTAMKPPIFERPSDAYRLSGANQRIRCPETGPTDHPHTPQTFSKQKPFSCEKASRSSPRNSSQIQCAASGCPAAAIGANSF